MGTPWAMGRLIQGPPWSLDGSGRRLEDPLWSVYSKKGVSLSWGTPRTPIGLPIGRSNGIKCTPAVGGSFGSSGRLTFGFKQQPSNGPPIYQ